MAGGGYLEGFIPYPEHVIREYVESGVWLNKTYGDIFDGVSSQYPGKMAVADDWNRLTYKELGEKISGFALALLELGVKKHDRLIIQLPNRHEFLVAFYAMHKIGAVPVLAVPRHGYQEISAFLKMTGASGWIVPPRYGKIDFLPLVNRLCSEFEDLKYVVMPEDGEIVRPPAYSMEKLIREAASTHHDGDRLEQFRPDPNDVAVLIPTGGTTGLPKIVPRTHNSLIAINRFLSTQRKITAKDILLQATPVGHAMAMYGAVNTAVFAGATLILQGVLRPTELLKTIQKEKITVVSMVPTQLEGVVNHPDLDQYGLRSLRMIGTAGSSLPLEIAGKAVEYFGRFGCEFAGNALGASEGIVTHGDFKDSLDDKLRKAGRNIIPGSHYKVIDEEQRDLPVDTVGELVVKGPEVFTGYYRSTEKENREVFTRDGYYRTGDLVKMDQRGYITVTGRKKDVIMRGGETLIPSEMERLIRQHPDVENVAVVAMPDSKMGERACAFVVSKPGKTFSFAQMVDFLRSQGAGDLLLPERLELIDRLPETNIGKVDKNALRKYIAQKAQ